MFLSSVLFLLRKMVGFGCSCNGVCIRVMMFFVLVVLLFLGLWFWVVVVV